MYYSYIIIFPNRKPFHPKRLNELWLSPFFADPIEKEEEIEDISEEEKEQLKELKVKLDEEKQEKLETLQVEALAKQKERNATMGELLRSKGFFWLATSNDVIGAWQQAGNVLRIRGESQWMCLTPQFWEGSEAEKLVREVRRVLATTIFHIIKILFCFSRICKMKMEWNMSTKTDAKKLFSLAME